MTINIVTEPAPGWVLRWISNTLSESLPDSVVSTSPRDDVEANIYINHALFKKKTKTLDIPYFTHLELDNRSSWDWAADNADKCLVMSNRYRLDLPTDKTYVIPSWSDKQFHKENIVLGVVGRSYPSGRKGLEIIDEIEKIDGIKVIFTEGNITWNNMGSFYDSIDYLLVTSYIEGGPIPILEAMTSGTPVIAPPVGFAWDYPVIRYSDVEELKWIFRKMLKPKTALKDAVKLIEGIIR